MFCGRFRTPMGGYITRRAFTALSCLNSTGEARFFFLGRESWDNQIDPTPTHLAGEGVDVGVALSSAHRRTRNEKYKDGGR